MTGKVHCHARAAARDMAVDQACLAQAEAKFSSAWQKIEARGSCVTPQDEAAIEAKVDGYVDDLVAALNTMTTTTTPTATTGACTTSTRFPPCAGQTAFCSSYSFGCPGGQTCTVVKGSCGPISCQCQ